MSDEAIQKPYVDYDYYSKDYRGTEASKTSDGSGAWRLSLTA